MVLPHHEAMALVPGEQTSVAKPAVLVGAHLEPERAVLAILRNDGVEHPASDALPAIAPNARVRFDLDLPQDIPRGLDVDSDKPNPKIRLVVEQVYTRVPPTWSTRAHTNEPIVSISHLNPALAGNALECFKRLVGRHLGRTGQPIELADHHRQV